MTTKGNRSPAAMVMDGAIDLAIDGRSPHPERRVHRRRHAIGGHDIERAADEGRSVVLASADGSTRVLQPGLTADRSPARVDAQAALRLSDQRLCQVPATRFAAARSSLTSLALDPRRGLRFRR